MEELHTTAVSELSSRQRKYLKGLAHDLQALVQVGKEGITSSLLEATSKELAARELLKVKLGKNSGLEKSQAGREIAERTSSNLVQIIGKTLVLYKANPKLKKDQRIHLPKQ